MLEEWQKEILDAQLAQERLYASNTPIEQMSRADAICVASYRGKHSEAERERRIKWLELSYQNPGLPLQAVK